MPYFIAYSFFLCALLQPAALAWADSADRHIHNLQRILTRGCGQALAIDGQLGPQTQRAYFSCRDRFGLGPAQLTASTALGFIESAQLAKRALILLHQWDLLKEWKSLAPKEILEKTLGQFCRNQGIEPAFGFNQRDIARLHHWYFTNPPPGSLAAALQEHGLPYEGLELYLQVFKLEAQALVFARPRGSAQPFIHLHSFAITGSPFPHPSGPKSQEGDSKVPEGIYQLTWQNLWSQFHLGYSISYPNDADRARRRHWQVRAPSGGDIVLHGGSATIGCVPLGDKHIEALYLLLDKNWQRQTYYGSIHIFPFRFDHPANADYLTQSRADRPQLAEFWTSLQPIYQYFARHKDLPPIDFSPDTGYYRIPRPAPPYPWLASVAERESLAQRLEPPAGFARVPTAAGSFGHWLRHLPLKPANTPVLLYNGQPKTNQAAHWAVVDINVGRRDLQQCADSILRLRSEYLYAQRAWDRIRFTFTSGDTAAYKGWIKGWRPKIEGRNVSWRRSASPDSSRQSFSAYLQTLFTYAGTLSLNRDLQTVAVDSLQIGDVFVQGGSPGHAVIVVDMVQNAADGTKKFALAQGFMPAQDLHILVNPSAFDKSPWYQGDFGTELKTPEWTFSRRDLRRF